MRIAILGTRGYPYVYSGYETFVSQLAPRLVERGHEVYVYCHRGLFEERKSIVNGVHLHYVPAIEHKVLAQFSHSLFSTLHLLFCRRDIVLYVNSANGPFGLLTKLFGKRTAINVDGLEWLRPKWKGLGARYFYISSWLSTKLFDVVITDSERMAEVYEKEFNSPSVTIAYGETVEQTSDSGLIGRMGLIAREYYLVVGRLIPDNNADLIVRAFEKTSTAKKLVILGDVPYKDSYAESVRRTTDLRIVFPGYIKDAAILKELYCNAYVYIHGHEFGGTNPALLKALACGNCVLALDTVFNREVLDGDLYGIFFKKDVSNIAQSISNIEANPAKAELLRQKARSRILDRYTWDRIIEQYVELFQSMVRRKRNRTGRNLDKVMHKSVA